MTLVLTREHDLGVLMPVLSYFITQSGLPLKVFIWNPHHTNALEFTNAEENRDAFFTQVEAGLKSADCPYSSIQGVTGPATLLAEEFGPRGLVASVIGRKDLAEDQPCMSLLARMESPVMMFWQ
jgi:hypothetical protein